MMIAENNNDVKEITFKIYEDIFDKIKNSVLKIHWEEPGVNPPDKFTIKTSVLGLLMVNSHIKKILKESVMIDPSGDGQDWKSCFENNSSPMHTVIIVPFIGEMTFVVDKEYNDKILNDFLDYKRLPLYIVLDSSGKQLVNFKLEL